MRIPLCLATLAVLLLFSCSRNSSPGNPSDIEVAETLIYNHQDSFFTNPREAGEHLSAAMSRLSDSSAINRLRLFLGMSQFLQGHGDDYAKLSRQIGDYCRRHPADHSLAGLYWNDCGIVVMLSGNADSAITCYERAYKELVLANDTARACDVSVNLAGLLRDKGEMARAADVLQESLALSRGNGRKPMTIRFAIRYMLGAVYSDMYSFRLADAYFRQAEGLMKYASLNDQYMFYNARGNRYFFEKQYRRAWNDFAESKSIAVKLNSNAFVAIAESNMGEILHSEGRDAEAMPLLLNAEKAIKASGAGEPRSIAYLNDLTAITMAHAGDKTGAARRFMATDTAAIAAVPRYMMIHHERLADFYHLTGDNALAYNHLSQARRYESEFRNKLFVEQMADAQQRYQRDKQVLSQRAEIERQKEHVRNLTVLIIVLAAFAMVVIVLILWSQRRKRQLLQLKFQGELTQLSLKNIHNRLSPHFIMNVLGRELAVNNEGVTRLIKFIRQNLMLVERNVIPMGEELDFIGSYVALERKALAKDFEYACNVAPEVNLQATMVPAMMIQVFVENAVKHGLRGQTGQLFLHIDVAKSGGGVEIVIDNNGSPAQSASSGTQTGIKVVRQTIDLFNKSNPEPVVLDYGPRGNGVWHVAITIPDGYKFKELK